MKIWSTTTADRKFSKWIIQRDKKCLICKRKPPIVKLTNSHFWGRHTSSVRYDPENCDAVCLGCHFKIENAKQGEYKDIKEKQLGIKRYNALRKRYYQLKMTRKEAILKCMELLKKSP